jgi:hypothetical protein
MLNVPAPFPAVSVSVAVATAPELMVKEETENLPVEPLGWFAASAKVAAGQPAESGFWTVTVKAVEALAFKETAAGEMETTGAASVQAAGTLNVAVPVPADAGLVVLVPVTLSENVPAAVPVFTVSVTEPLAPEAMPVTDVFENVPVNPVG